MILAIANDILQVSGSSKNLFTTTHHERKNISKIYYTKVNRNIESLLSNVYHERKLYLKYILQNDMLFILHVAASNISCVLTHIMSQTFHLSARINIIVKEKAPTGAHFFYLVGVLPSYHTINFVRRNHADEERELACKGERDDVYWGSNFRVSEKRLRSNLSPYRLVYISSKLDKKIRSRVFFW